ncbi:MAG: phosphoribosyltransferase [Micrococcales bacterium]|nr:phosphoribosyltransferase [Micrococcales bacterium]
MYYSYEAFNLDVDKIVDDIKRSQWRPQLIVGVQRGGLIPAVRVSHLLGVDMSVIRWSTKNPGDIHKPIDVRLACSNKRVLVIDDIIDSGGTARGIINELPAIQYGCLIWNIRETSCAPHFFGRTLDRNIDKEWITFWWESCEQPFRGSNDKSTSSI